jgi:hypothetical protein
LKKFNVTQNQLAYQFQERYAEIITIFYVIELKAKVSNFERRAGKSIYENVGSIEFLPEHLHAKGKTKFEFRIRFNFCEIAYHPRIDLKKKSIS